jgi:alkyl-hydroperoxide reductase/thiol specific antioxidant family protein
VHCLETTAQLRGRLKDIEAAGAELILVGNGSIEQALNFQRARAPEVRVFTDPTLESYKALGMRRSVAATLGLSSIVAGARATARGFIQTSTEGDGFQQGGTYAVAKGGTIVYSQPNRSAGDRPDIDAALQALGDAPERTT